MSNESKRIVFTFSARDISNLEKLVKLGNYGSLADAVRDAIKNMATIEEAKADGSKVEVKKIPKNGEVQILQVG